MQKKLTLLSLAFLVCSACERGAKTAEDGLAPEPVTVRIGLVTWLGYGPFYIAQEEGFFKEEGIVVELLRIEGDAERRAAIASGNLDGSALTLDAMIVLRSKGIPVRTVMAIDASNGGDGIVATEAVKTVADLRGKEVAFPSGLPSHYFLYSVLAKHNLKMSDIKPIIMDADKAGAAFAAGQVDVAVTWEPWLSKARESANGHVLVDSKQHHGAIEDVLFMREEFIREHPDAVKALIKAWYKSVDFVKSDPEKAKRIMARAFGLSEEQVAELLPTVIYEGRKGNLTAFGVTTKPGSLYALYERISRAWLKEGVISRRDQPSEGLYPDFVRNLH